jgi:hypothetical protein
MSKVLNASATTLYWKIVLFLLILSISAVSAYFLIYQEEFIFIIIIGFSCFFIPWSYFELLEVSELKRRQFQKLAIKEEHLLFEHLRQRGGEKISLPVAYENIKSIGVKKSCLSVQVVRRQNWNGTANEFFIPMGTVPKSQLFALPSNQRQRAEIINFLTNKGVEMEQPTKRYL